MKNNFWGFFMIAVIALGFNTASEGYDGPKAEGSITFDMDSLRVFAIDSTVEYSATGEFKEDSDAEVVYKKIKTHYNVIKNKKIYFNYYSTIFKKKINNNWVEITDTNDPDIMKCIKNATDFNPLKKSYENEFGKVSGSNINQTIYETTNKYIVTHDQYFLKTAYIHEKKVNFLLVNYFDHISYQKNLALVSMNSLPDYVQTFFNTL